MTTFRALTLGLLASTALATPAFAQNTQSQTTGQSPAPGTNATDVTAPPPPVRQSQGASSGVDQSEIIITATKREENVQNVPINVIALGTRRLDQLNISNFEEYTRQLPSVSYLTAAPGSTVVYMRGISAAGSGAEGNHSGPLPQVGSYLDEQPITTIGGTLDVHIYDIARIESLSGPQGTLYGASSEAGTIRIITNKPELGVTTGRVDAQLNAVGHGGVGGSLEGMINLPIASRIAFRGVAFYQHDAGYIDNVHGSRSYYAFPDDFTGPTVDFPDAPPAANIPTLTVTNSGLEKKNFNDVDIWGGRAALKVDLNDDWTATPTFMYQKTKSNGVFFFDPNLGDLKIDRFFKEPSKDRFWQAALTIEGKIHNFDITYAGAYMDRPTSGIADYTDYADAYDRLYADYADYAGAYGRGLAYFQYLDANGNRTISPQQFIEGSNHFKKLSQELRFASPAENRFRVIGGAFYQVQKNFIHQDYKVAGLAPALSVNGFPGTLWLTQQKRKDKDYALFGEASFDVTSQITLTAGGRWYKYDNSLIGFFGFGRNPAFFQGASGNPPVNPANSTRTGVAACFTQSGDTLRNSQLNGTDTVLLPAVVPGSPCTNLADIVDGKLVPKRTKDSGFIHRLNGQWKPQENLMFYATWSRGFRPGGINRRADVPPYAADFLSNYELGWKTTLGPVRWNGAIYHELWKKFQFAFLGANSFTEIHNGKDARVNGIETDFNYVNGGWTVNAAAAYTDAKTKGNICSDALDLTSDCTGSFIAAPSGTRLPVTPKFKGTFTTRYSWLAFSDVKAHVQGAISYQGSAPSSIRTEIELVGTGEHLNPNDFQGKLGAATLVDLYAGLDWQKWNLELFATNIFDKRNDISRFTACGSCTRALVVPGRPRTIGIRAGTKF